MTIHYTIAAHPREIDLAQVIKEAEEVGGLAVDLQWQSESGETQILTLLTEDGAERLLSAGLGDLWEYQDIEVRLDGSLGARGTTHRVGTVPAGEISSRLAAREAYRMEVEVNVAT